MIVEIKGLCQWPDCREVATHIAAPNRYTEWDDDLNSREVQPPPGCYCLTHAEIIARDNFPEYVRDCPNCGCKFGI